MLGLGMRSRVLLLVVLRVVGWILVMLWKMGLLLDWWLGHGGDWCSCVWGARDRISLECRRRRRTRRWNGEAQAIGNGRLRRHRRGLLDFEGGSCGRRGKVDR